MCKLTLTLPPPPPVHIQQERQALYVSKVIDKVPDEELETANCQVTER